MWHSREALRSLRGFVLVSDRKRNQPGKIKPPVNCGALLIFPSYLQHSVDADAGSESRASVSFNLMFSAFTAELSKPLWGDE